MYGYNLHGLNGRHSTPEKGCEIKSVKVEPYSYNGGLGPEATGSHTRPLSSPSLSPSFPFPSPFLNLSAISFPPMLSHSLFHFPSSPPLRPFLLVHLRVWGSAVSSLIGLQGGSLATNALWPFYLVKTHLVTTDLVILRVY